MLAAVAAATGTPPKYAPDDSKTRTITSAAVTADSLKPDPLLSVTYSLGKHGAFGYLMGGRDSQF
jgi:hypothetical protein